MINPIKLSPFQKFCVTIGMIPSSYKSSLTYEEQLMWFCNYLENTVIPAVDNNAEALQEVQNLFTQLQNYVNSYFDNLDVQQEINNKLDEMAEDGTLEEIVIQYLNIKGILAFNNINEMKNASNIINGSFCKTFGKNFYNDGYGEFYKIRTITSNDNVDEINIISLSISNTLIAELIPNAYNQNFNQRISNLENYNLTEIAVVGDSYTALDNSTWAEDLAQSLHLNLHKSAQSGLGYLRQTSSNTYFIDLLNRFLDKDNFPELYMNEALRNKTKYLITYGGINDYGATENALTSAVQTYCTRAKALFPNAQIIIVGPQMAISDVAKIRNLTLTKAISKGAMSSGCSYTDAKFWLIDTPYQYNETYSNDNLHPSPLGYKIITSKMLNLVTGNLTTTDEISFEFTEDNLTDGNIEIKRSKEALIIQIYARGTFPNGVSTKIGTFSPGGSKYFINNKRYPVFKRDTNNCPTALLGGIVIGSGTNLSVINNTGSNYTGAIMANFVIPIAPYNVEYSQI